MNALTRGLGDFMNSTPTFSMAPGSSGHGSCSATYWNLVPWAAGDPDCYQPTMLIPHAPAISTTLAPDGTVTPETAQENQARYGGMIQDFLDNLVGDTTPPDPKTGNGLGALLLIGFAIVLASSSGGSGKGRR